MFDSHAVYLTSLTKSTLMRSSTTLTAASGFSSDWDLLRYTTHFPLGSMTRWWQAISNEIPDISATLQVNKPMCARRQSISDFIRLVASIQAGEVDINFLATFLHPPYGGGFLHLAFSVLTNFLKRCGKILKCKENGKERCTMVEALMYQTFNAIKPWLKHKILQAQMIHITLELKDTGW